MDKTKSGLTLNFFRLKIKWQLFLILLFFTAVPMIIIGFTVYNQAKTELISLASESLRQNSLIAAETVTTINKLGTDNLHASLNVAREIFYSYGVPAVVDGKIVMTAPARTVFQKDENGKMVGVSESSGAKYVINDNFDIVDKITSLVGGTATVFQLKDFQGESKDDVGSVGWTAKQAFYRVSTNVKKTDGSRALGTVLSRAVFDRLLNGETYIGKANILGKSYQAAYEPIKDGLNNIIGVLYVGVLEQDYIDNMKTNLAKLTIGKSGYIYIIDDQGNYILSKDKARDGENIWESKDSNGNFFIQDMIKAAKNLKLGESGLQQYFWQNTGEPQPRQKIAGFAWVPERNWVVIAGMYLDDYDSSFQKILNVIIIISVLSIIIGSLFVFLFGLRLTGAMQKLKKMFMQINDGDLNIVVDEKLAKDSTEIGEMSRAFYKMIDTIKSIMTTIKQNITSTAASAEQLSASAQQVNASMQQFMSTGDVVAKTALSVSRGATEVQQATDLTSTSAEKGGKAAQIVKEKMSVINSTTVENAGKIKALGERSNKISNIVETINSISEQTNLLALNAAIEAARAGEAGRGFAVVADEVRKLAEESSQATDQISDLINDIKREINTAVESMDKNAQQVNDGTASIQEALKSFEAIPVLVDNINLALMKMVSTAEENASGTNLLSSSIQQVTSAMQQISSAAQQLNAGAEELRQVADKFKIK